MLDIHSMPVELPAFLIKPENSLSAILEECEAMIKTYMESPLGEEEVKKQIGSMLDKAWEIVKETKMEDFKEKVYIYTKITCLRGIAWCAMAWIEYQNPERLIRNENTFQKLEQYIDKAFLYMIDRKWLS